MILTNLAERYIPDAFVFALIATFLIVGVAVLGRGQPVLDVVQFWGNGVWELIPFTLQMAMVIITGHVLAAAPVVHRAITRLAQLPRSPKAAVAFVAFVALLLSWFNWGFSLVFSALLAREVAKRVEGVDYRALAASSFLGLGSIWAQGLSSSAALQMATASAMPASMREIIARSGARGGIIPLGETIFHPRSLLCSAIELLLVPCIMYWAAPARARDFIGPAVEPPRTTQGEPVPSSSNTPGEWLEHRPWLSWLFVLLSGSYLVTYFFRAEHILSAINLNVLNLAFLTLGVLLHRTPARFMLAFKAGTPGIWGVLLQFPFYAGIAAVIVKTHLNDAIASLFVSVSNQFTFPALVAIYSIVLGVFVPSGGVKWVIEAPYVLTAAHDVHVHLGWTVTVYNLGEALANLIQPFWMLPILGLLGLKARDVMGYTFLVFVTLTPLVLTLVTLLAPR